MHGIICSFYVEGVFEHSTELMSAKSALCLIKSTMVTKRLPSLATIRKPEKH